MKRHAPSMDISTSRKKLNGHAGANGSAMASAAAPNGHTELGKAGSDDAREFSAANTSSLGSTAGADRAATADLAESAAEGRSRRGGAALGRAARGSAQTGSVAATGAKADGKVGGKAQTVNPFADVPPGRKSLPRDGEAFVRAVHRQVDLIELEVKLLRNKDGKVVQRELAYLRELRYVKRAPVTEQDSEPALIFDLPRPERKVQ